MAKNPPPKPTRESLAISRALKARGKGASAELADLIGKTPGTVSQWATARRPVPPDLAPLVADYLGLQPEVVSAAYARIPQRVGESAPIPYGGQLPPEVARAPQDIDAINMTLAVLVHTMVKHRPAEAADAAAAIRKMVPPAFRERGLIQELLTTLDGAAAAKRSKG